MASIKIKTDGIFQRIPLLAKLAQATDFILGGFKTGYVATETTTPVLLDEEGRAYVEVTQADTSNLASKQEVSELSSSLENKVDQSTYNSEKENFATKQDTYTKEETDSEIDAKIASLVNSAPEDLNTLKELADALGNDEQFSTTVLNQIATKADSEQVYTKEQTYNKTEINQMIINEIYVSSDGSAPQNGETIWIDLSA